MTTPSNPGFSMPDITPAQIIAVVGAIVGVIVAAGLPLSQDLQDAIIRLVTVLAPVVLLADGLIRHGRSKIAAAKLLADSSTTNSASV